MTAPCRAENAVAAGLLSSSDEEVRRSAVIALACCPVGESRPLLVAALADDSWRVRKEAARALIDQGPDAGLLRLLVQALGDEANAGLRNGALEVLAAFEETAIPALTPVIGEVDPEIRKFLAELFARGDDPVSLAALTATLDDPDPNVVISAVESLGARRAVTALPSLLRILEHPSLWVRYAVLEAVTAIGGSVPAPALPGLAAETHLRPALFACLAVSGDASALPLLLDGAREQSPRLALAAIRAVAAVRRRLDPAARADLDRRLRDDSDDALPLRLAELLSEPGTALTEVVELAGIVASPRLISPLIRSALTEELRPSCCAALRAFGPGAGPMLEELFSSGSEEERRIIMALAGLTELPQSTELISRGLQDRSAPVRAAAAASAVDCDAPELMAPLASVCGDHDPEVRYRAEESLVAMAGRFPEESGRVARRLAVSPDETVREVAARLYALSGELDGAEHLLRDRSPSVRAAAVVGLRGRSDSGVRDLLVLALADEDVRVRSAAVTTLGAAAGGDSVEPLIMALHDPSPEVACAALAALPAANGRAFAAAVECLGSVRGLVLLAALEAAVRIDPQRSAAHLPGFLHHEDAEVVATTLRLLAEVRDSSWYDPESTRLSRHTCWEVRMELAAAVAAVRPAGWREFLTRMLADEADPFVSRKVAALLETVA